MARRWRSTRVRVAALALAGLAAVAYPIYRAAAARPVRRTLRVGFQNSPPYHFSGANNQPTGPTVETLKAAAVRAGINLEWVYLPDGPEKALTSGGLDL